MEIAFRNKGDNKILQFSGNLDIYTSPIIKKQALEKIEEEEVKSFIFDMSKVNYFDSSGIALIANLRKRMLEREGKFALLSISYEIKSVLQLASMDRFFTIYATEEEIN
ncbi:MAG TPA: STAS domain-containing protein [Leptospiraceae bacterium]|nr:STAS domain-containing protein [Leptospiraceae bacterium]HMW07338.1 STAS domain-containing protein [Leptospiraceae bacterium]HMX33388.1 STAS domain-containing protein [Leptospiraceae bacterium]HMY32954.1 STAS domain-containing protein [Leptospiraceae bacterium]HMZ64568.1 STAS domain-containing protein [Leptospiraceae bacterium]